MSFSNSRSTEFEITDDRPTATATATATATPPPALAFTLKPTVDAPGIPTEAGDDFTILLDNAVSGGGGTATYLRRMLAFAAFADYLKKSGTAAFSTADGPRGSRRSIASDGTTQLEITVALNDGLRERDVNGIPVRGLATVRMSTVDPLQIAKDIQFGISIAEIPAGLAVTDALMDALFTPLLSRLGTFLQSSIQSWLEADVGELDGIADTLADAAADVAEDIAEETSEIVVDELVAAELSLDLAAIAPPLAALGLLMIVPLLIGLLAKQFQVHFEVTNYTDSDVEWTLEHAYNGAMTARPASPVIPKMGRATDAWGDTTDVPVAYQADFFSTNSSGFAGTGYAIRLSAAGLSGEDIAVVVSVPWALDNAIWLGPVPADGNWARLYDNVGSDGALAVEHGTRHLHVEMGIDALSGHHDSYHCALRITEIPPDAADAGA